MTDGPAQLPVIPPPPDGAPDLMPYAQWRQDEDRGARAAHDDARLPEDERAPADDVAAEGFPYWNGYQRHISALRDSGVIR